MRDSQAKRLEEATVEIFSQIKNGSLSDIHRSQKDIDFVIYARTSRRVLASSNAKIPPLPLARGVQRYSLKNQPDSENKKEKNMDILYLCRTYKPSDGKEICIQVSVPAEKEISQVLFLIFPRSLLKILIPLLLFLFVTFSFYFIVLERKYDTQKEFIANVSHELKTPVAVIAGHTDLLRRHGKELLEKDDGRFDESLALILKESNKMTRIVQDLLELTRLENRLTRLQKENISVREFFGEIKEEINGRHEENGADILIETAPIPDDYIIKTDRNLLKQIFRIGIENSIKHSNSQNLKITLGVEKTGRKTMLFIGDNGEGFSEEALKRAFDRFYSGDKSHKTGSGIGLSIVKSITRVLGVKVRLENDSGAVVKIIIPA
ncbi:MAG: HAMP domain-containing histidine kinase [Treponema sp.]|nr:HAMP domain-containing histidine kinase [Treponema sp.]